MKRTTVGDLRKFLDEKEKEFKEDRLYDYYGDFNLIEVLIDHFDMVSSEEKVPIYHYKGIGASKLLLDHGLGLLVTQEENGISTNNEK